MSTDSNAVRWATKTGISAEVVTSAWQAGKDVAVPIGEPWEVLRMTVGVGCDALRRLRDSAIGPVILDPSRATLEILLPPGAAGNWPKLDGIACEAEGELLCPHPCLTTAAGHYRSGRQWLIPPVPAGTPQRCPKAPWTDGDALCEAIIAASARSAWQFLEAIRARETTTGTGISAPPFYSRHDGLSRQNKITNVEHRIPVDPESARVIPRNAPVTVGWSTWPGWMGRSTHPIRSTTPEGRSA